MTGGNAGAGGEPLRVFLERLVRDDPFLQELKARARDRPVPSLPPMLFPADWTRATWERDCGPLWPDGEKELPSLVFAEARRAALIYGVNRAVRRVVTDFLDSWKKRDLDLLGLRPNGVVETLCPGLRGSHFMALHLWRGLFVPTSWQGQAPPADLPRYSDLTVLASATLPKPAIATTAESSNAGAEPPPSTPSPTEDLDLIDLNKKPPHLARYTEKEKGIHRATHQEIDACFQCFAEKLGGKIPYAALRNGRMRHWLRKNKQADTSDRAIEQRFKEAPNRHFHGEVGKH